MKKLTLILVMFISSITFAQECFPDCPEPVVFDFSCEIDPLTITDAEIEAFADRDALLQALVGLTTSKGQIVTAVEYPESTTVFIVKVRTAWGSFTSNTSGFGKELILDEMLPENFREFYKNILNYIITDF